MPRYIEGSEVKFTENDKIFVDVEFYTGEKFTELELHRMFPITGLTKYIALLDKEGNEIAVIRNIEDLMPESKKVVENCLREYYMIPRIIRFIKMSEKFKIWMWTAETDKGICTFEIRNHITAIKPLYDGRVLIKDANDNRYEIPNVNDLDKKSLSMILPKL
ncbi:MAG: DUF1854 domain-containing protein [Clostridia bacterium]|nr:DUF1854 domain-containing protein [Clostridia bacterium]